MTVDEHARAFMAYVAGLLAEFLREFANVAQPRLANAPGKGRRRRMVYTVFLPAPHKLADETDAGKRTRRSRTRARRSS